MLISFIYLFFIFCLQNLNPFFSAVPNPGTSDNPENLFLSDYRGFPVLTNENEHRIWILQVKVHTFKEKKIPLLFRRR